MNNKLKIVLGYTLLFIESLLVFIITMILLLKATLLNSSYIKNQFQLNDYYKKAYSEIKTEMSYYTEQSGFDDSIIEDIFTLTDVKNASNRFINSIYNGEKDKTNTLVIEEKLNKKIDEYIQNENFQITNRDEIDKFVKEMGKVFNNEVRLMGYLDKVSKYIPKIDDLFDYGIIFLSIILMFLVIINAKFFKRKDFGVIFYTSAFLMIFITVSIVGSIDINNISIYSETISNITKIIFKDMLKYIIFIACGYIGFGVLCGALKKEKRHRRKHENN